VLEVLKLGSQGKERDPRSAPNEGEAAGLSQKNYGGE